MDNCHSLPYKQDGRLQHPPLRTLHHSHHVHGHRTTSSQR